MTERKILSRSIAGKVAIVTGAASGMGRATAQIFAAEGASVIATDVNAEGLDETVRSITSIGDTAHGWTMDVSDPTQTKTVVGEARERFGPIDILVNNAGVSASAPIDSPDYDEIWERTIAINLTAHIRMIRLCLDDLKRDGAGRIVNIASTEGLGATNGASPYTASKHGVVGLTRSLAVELGRQGVTVNCICPGPIRTGMTAEIPDEKKEKFARRRVPMRRYGYPEEVAHATLSLVLPAASYINGAILPVDGGLIVQNT